MKTNNIKVELPLGGGAVFTIEDVGAWVRQLYKEGRLNEVCAEVATNYYKQQAKINKEMKEIERDWKQYEMAKTIKERNYD